MKQASRIFTVLLGSAFSLSALAAANIRCFQPEGQVLGDFSLSRAAIHIDQDHATLKALTQGKDSDQDDDHQGIANQKLATLSAEAAAYFSKKLGDWYQIDISFNRKSEPNVCAELINPAFAVDCYSNKKPVASVTITDVTDTKRPPFVYEPTDHVSFVTEEEDDFTASGEEKWQKFTIKVDKVEISESYLLEANCTYQ